MNDYLSALARHWSEWFLAASWQLALLVALLVAVALFTRRFSARFRYLLWSLVLLKAFLPPAIGTQWGIGNLIVRPASSWMRQTFAPDQPQAITPAAPAPVDQLETPPQDSTITAVADAFNADLLKRETSSLVASVPAPVRPQSRLSTTHLLMLGWLAGFLFFLIFVFWRYVRILRLLRYAVEVDEGPLRIALERLSQSLGIKTTPALALSEHVHSPFLMGVLRPRIVLPLSLPMQISAGEMNDVLLHELTHYRRRDLLVGWLQVFVQAVYWFHPFVWFAGAQLQHERECACDEEALATGHADPAQYGKSLLQVLLSSRGQSAAAMGFLGIFERNTRIQQRLEEIMNQNGNTKTLSWRGWLFIGLFIIACLPMAPTVQSQTPAPNTTANGGHFDEQLSKPVTLTASKSPDGDRLTVQYAAIAICEAVGIPYQWKKSAQLAEPERRSYIEPISFQGQSAKDALMQVLRPMKLKYEVDAQGLYLCHAEQAAAPQSQTATQAPPATPQSATPLITDEPTLGNLASQFAGQGKLVEAIDKEMGRVMLRAQNGHAYKDKIDLIPIYEQFIKANRPDPATLATKSTEIQQYLKQHETNVEYNWRVKHLLSRIAADANQAEEAAKWLDAALEAYPDIAYQDPAKQSKYQHLINERAMMILEKQGPDAAEAYLLDHIKTDPKIKYFFDSPWRDEFEKRNMSGRYESLKAKAVEAEKGRQATLGSMSSPAEDEGTYIGLWQAVKGKELLTIDIRADNTCILSEDEDRWSGIWKKQDTGIYIEGESESDKFSATLSGNRMIVIEIAGQHETLVFSRLDPQTTVAPQSPDAWLSNLTPGQRATEQKAAPATQPAGDAQAYLGMWQTGRGAKVLTAEIRPGNQCTLGRNGEIWNGTWKPQSEGLLLEKGQDRFLAVLRNGSLEVTEIKRNGEKTITLPFTKISPTSTAPDGQSNNAWLSKLDPGQRAFWNWTETEFSKFIDNRAFPNLTEQERKRMEGELIDALRGPHNENYFSAINTLAALKSQAAVEPLLSIATDPRDKNNRDRWMAVRSLGMLENPSIVPQLIHLVYHPNPNTGMMSQCILVKMTGQNFGIDWQAWVNWWNATGRAPLASVKQVQWSKDPQLNDVAKVKQNQAQWVQELQNPQAARSDMGNATNQQGQASPPQIISTSPAVGQTEVDPSITEITITFDQDMAGGFSWTGGGPEYPKIPEGMKPMWRDKRTCVLPVQLEAAHMYRVGINSKSHQNFRSAAGIPVAPSAIYFATVGADTATASKMQKPKVVKMEPANGATNVDPNLKELRVTFDMPMGEGRSWCGGGETFPLIPQGIGPSWSEDKLTAILPVQLKANWTYNLGLNSPSNRNFTSASGVALDPVPYTFSTGKMK